MDVLSELLKSLRLTGGIFLAARFTAPWCVTAQVSPEDCRVFQVAAGSVVAYHLVTEGQLIIGVDGKPPVAVSAGEIVLFPRNDQHVMGSAILSSVVKARTLIQPSPDGSLARIDFGGGGDVTRLYCGFLASGDGRHALLDGLPAVMKVDARRVSSRDWIDSSVRFAAGELEKGRLAASELISRLSELLFAEAVEAYFAQPDADTALMRAIRDPHIGRSLVLLHRDITVDWSADDLAREVGLSRSVFMERFRNLIGMPPIRYLAHRRLETARHQLQTGNASVGSLAYRVGYESEEAFSRAFKRAYGLAPAHWRLRNKATPRLPS